MTNLECCVCTCKYNENNCCCKSEITVGKRESHSSKETECDSFVKAKEMAVNAVNNPIPELTINCDAVNCVYNANKKCSAKHVGIAGNRANVSDETCCETFKLK